VPVHTGAISAATLGFIMLRTSELAPDQKLYPVGRLAMTVDALAAEGISAEAALAGTGVSKAAVSSPTTRVSLNQIFQCYRNAIEFSRNPLFAYRTGLRSHVSSYGMYGFAILSSTNLRETMRFALQYHQLAAPLGDLSFRHDQANAVLSIDPAAYPAVDAPLYRFIVEVFFGSAVSLLRDVMGPAFVPRAFHVTYPPRVDVQDYRPVFECDVLFGESENKMIFDAGWLDAVAKLGDRITYPAVVEMCNRLLDEIHLREGVSGAVRRALLVNLAEPPTVDAIARYLGMPSRTLRRKLAEERTSFREFFDEIRMHVAIKYLRDTELTPEDVASALGFSNAESFRRAFRRWTWRAPKDFRNVRTERHDK
jgi:AraC-like DNA-binding protein